MKRIALLLFTINIAWLAQAEVVDVSDHGFIVKNQFTTVQPATKVWQALINDVDKWWPKSHSWWGETSKFQIEAKAGGCFCEIAGDKSAEHMRISFVEPNTLLRMTGGLGPLQGMGAYGALDWSLSESASGTTVTLTYTVVGYSPQGFEQLAPIVATVQSLQLTSLQRFTEDTGKN